MAALVGTCYLERYVTTAVCYAGFLPSTKLVGTGCAGSSLNLALDAED
jgi:hypothetical protein